MRKVDWSLNATPKNAFKHELVEVGTRASVARVLDADEAVFMAKAINSHKLLIRALSEAKQDIEWLRDEYNPNPKMTEIMLARITLAMAEVNKT